MTKLIALALIAMVLVPGATQDIAPDTAFETTPEAAEPLLTQGLAKLSDASLGTQAKPGAAEKTVKVRLLVDGPHGKCNDLATLPAAEAKDLEAAGQVDSSKAAVAYATLQAAEAAKAK